MSLIVVTPTGDRPETINLLEKFMDRQTVKPVRWILIDDGKTPCRQIKRGNIYRRKPGFDDPPHTLVTNMQMAMAFVMPFDRVVVMEDDDWYAPNYIEEISKHLDEFDIVGQAGSFYYHFPESLIWNMGNTNHASLCQTGFKAAIMQGMDYPDNFSLDLALWRLDVKKKLLDKWPPLAIGMKGLPGRPGQSAGWNVEKYRDKWQSDPNREWLRNQIGDDLKLYERMYE